MNKYATAITIGCRLNQADTAMIFDELKSIGFDIVPQKTEHKISLIIINTCAVTASASQKSRQAARSMKNKYPDSFIVVTGCSIETEKNTWETEDAVDLIIPNAQKTNIVTYLKDNKVFRDKFFSDSNLKIKAKELFDINKNFSYVNMVGLYPFKCRANIKIQDGCDSFCTYCIVPYGRGRPRSRDFRDTVREFKELVNRGYKEIVLTGVNIAMYNDSGKDLTGLLSELIKVHGEYRIRLSSTEPQFNNHGLIEIIKSTDKICRFLHLPVQHGSNEILKRMGRSYTSEEFALFAEKAVSAIPDICLGTDIITGFPGETDILFNESKSFIEKLPLAYMHVFQYSRRKGTPAAEYPDQIHNRTSTIRHKILSEISSIMDKSYLKSQVDKILPVLFERKDKNGFFTGWSDNYVKVKLPSVNMSKINVINKILKIKTLKASGIRELLGE